MFLFCVSEPIDLIVEAVSGSRPGWVYRPSLTALSDPAETGSRDRVRLCAPSHGRITEAELYLAFSRPFLEQLAEFSRQVGRPIVRLLSRNEQARALALPGMPVRLGYYDDDPERATACLAVQLESARLEPPLRVAIMNPFGLAYGDSIVVLTALREFHAQVERCVGAVEVDILQHPDNVETEALYLQSGFIGAVHHLPAPVSLFARYDAYVDFSSPYNSRDLPWVDEILTILAIQPDTIPANRKRNALPRRPAVPAEVRRQVAALKARRSRLLLFHHRASEASRSIPEHLVSDLLQRVLELTDWTIVSAIPVPFSSPRFIDWSDLSKTFDRLVYLISQVDAFLSVDTCVYHAADAVDTPGVVLFTSIQPDHRTTYYPRIHSILLGGEDNPMVGKFPVNLDAFNGYLASSWAELDIPAVVETLETVMAEKQASLGGGYNLTSVENDRRPMPRLR